MKRFCRAGVLLVCFIMLSGAVVKAAVLLEDDFNGFDQSVWRAMPGSSVPARQVRGPVVENGVLTLRESECFDYTNSRPRFRYATINYRIRVNGDKSSGYYLGFMDRDNWNYNSLMLMTFGDRSFNLGLVKNGGQRISVGSTGVLQDNRWYDVKIAWSPDRAELFLDGKSCGFTTDKKYIPEVFLPAIFDLNASQSKMGSGLDLDRISVEGTEKLTSAEVRTTYSLPTNSQLYPTAEKDASAVPFIKIEAGKSGVIENGCYRYSFVWQDGFRLAGLQNKYNRQECLKEGGSPRFFSVTVNGKRIDSDSFRVVRTEVSGSKDRKDLLITLVPDGYSVEAELKLSADRSARLVCELAVKNTGRDRLDISVLFPLVEGVNVGGNIKENYYYFPFEGGYCGNAVFDLRCEYGGAGQMQILDVFNRQTGGGLYLYPRDTSGASKTLVLRKLDQDNTVPPSFPTILSPKSNPGEIFGFKSGVVMAMNNPEDSIAAGSAYRLTPTVFGVHQGDWHQPLAEYSRWVHTWYRPVSTPRWFKDFFNYFSVHDHLGNYGFSKGFYSTEKNKYTYSEEMDADREDQVAEWFGWWDRHEEPNLTYGLRWGFMGDYDYPENRGGLPALKEEIRKVHAKGGRVILYMEITQCYKGTRIGAAHGKEWARMDAPGAYNQDYWNSSDDGWIVCSYEPGWQDYISKRLGQVIRDTGADGFRLDRGDSLYPCFNADHSHYKGTVKSTLSAGDMALLLEKVRREVKKANPEAVVEAECFGSDYLAQFIDGSLDHKHAYGLPEYAEKNALNGYEINFWRFCFPESKLYLWGEGLYDDNGPKRGFFNGMAVERSDAPNPQDGERRVRYLGQIARLFKENGDAFSTLNPVPLVRTEKDFVYANEFPTAGKTIYTLWNRSDAKVEGRLLSVPAKSSVHYVELYYDNPVFRNSDKGKKTGLSFAVAAQDVVCLAQLPEILFLKQKGDTLEISLKGKDKKGEVFLVVGEDKPVNQRKVELKNGTVKASLAGVSKGTRFIVKLLRNGYLADEAVDFKE